MLFQAIGLHIGAFGPPFRPPMLTNVILTGNGVVIGRIFPTQNITFITCTDPHDDAVHHFLHTDFHLNQCLWAGLPSEDTKAIIFQNVRNWCENHAGITPKANFTNPLDLNSWYKLYW